MSSKLVLSLAFCLCVPIMASDTTHTATRLFTAILAEHEKNGQPNFVFSPVSVLGVFHMAQLGAGGDTKKEMDALVSPDEHFKLPTFNVRKEDGQQCVMVETANRIYAHSSLEGNAYFENFNKKLGLVVGSDAKTVDFAQAEAAAEEMNKFVEERTHGHITNLIDSSTLSASTRVVLLSALYFKARWMSQFQTEATREGVFHGETVDGPKQQRVKFMRQLLDGGFTYFQGSEVTAFSISYLDERLRMYVFMPADMRAFESKIAAEPEEMEKLAARVKSALPSDIELHLEFPKFKLDAKSNSVDLVDLFRRLGARRMFDPADSDFSGMTGSREFSISSYVHQADIEVDEQGTEATAATAMGVVMTSITMPKTSVRFVVDKPFLFQVRFEHKGRTPLVLFAGRISDARAAQ